MASERKAERTVVSLSKNSNEPWMEELFKNHGVCPGCKQSWQEHAHVLGRKIYSHNLSYVELCGYPHLLNTAPKYHFGAMLYYGEATADSLLSRIKEALTQLKATPTKPDHARVTACIEKQEALREASMRLLSSDTWTFQP